LDPGPVVLDQVLGAVETVFSEFLFSNRVNDMAFSGDSSSFVSRTLRFGTVGFLKWFLEVDV
jgi:hypothetical protein